LVVDEGQCPGAKLLLVIASLHHHRERRLRRSHLLHDFMQLVLRQSELHINRLQLGDHHKASGGGCMNDIALIHQPETGASRERRLDRCVIKLNLSSFDIGLIGLGCCFELLN
jgi:hypothetical protein